jgi:hypothetical protein
LAFMQRLSSGPDRLACSSRTACLASQITCIVTKCSEADLRGSSAFSSVFQVKLKIQSSSSNPPYKILCDRGDLHLFLE